MMLGLLIAVPAVALAQDAGDPTGAPSPAPPAPVIQSDKEDYPPADTVILTGSGWQPGETVNINVNDDEGQTWNRNVDVTADENGGVRDEFVLPDWFVATYSVTATGSSGITATSTFTDAVLPARGCPPHGGPFPGDPAVIVVNTIADQFDPPATPPIDPVTGQPTGCSLREAISAANADPNTNDRITLPQGTYTLTRTGTNEDNNQTGDLDITRQLTINGGGARDTFIQAGTTASTSTTPGNGIDRVLHVSSNGNLTMNGATVRYGKINDDGGGIKTNRRVTLTDVAITDNEATTGKSGGGISHQGDVLILDRVLINDNTASLDGGGLHSTLGTDLLTNVTITDNSATGTGGGMRTAGAGGTLNHVTVSHNSAPNGSNISRNSTIGNPNIFLRNTIVSDPNPKGIDGTPNSNGIGANCSGTLINDRNNLDSGTSCGFLTQSSSKSSANADLGNLEDNGGPTNTRELGAQSAAIDAAAGGFICADVDQRNLPRPQDASGNGIDCDIGAYELQANTAPVANDDAATSNEDTSVAIDVKANDTDANGNSLSVVASSLSDPANGTVALITSGADSGTVRYTPDPNYNNTGGANADTFTYKVSDGTAESNAATVRVTVNPDNDAPTISEIANQETDEDVSTGAISFTVGDVETAAGSLEVEGSSSNTTLVPNNNIVFGGSGANRTVAITPAADEFGTTEITVTGTDANGGTVSDTFTLTVNPVNDPPVANDDEYNTNEDTQLQVAAPGVLDNDSDVEGSTLSADLGTGPSDGTLDLEADGSFTYDPDPNFNGSDSFTYRASDGSTNSDLSTVDITVDSVNDPPTTPGAITPTASLNNDGAFTLDWALSTDVDGDDVTYTLEKRDANDDTNWTNVVSGPTSASYTFGGTNPVEDEGTWDYRVKAVDSPAGGESDYSTAENLVKVDKSGPNDPTLSFNTSANQSLKATVSGVDWYKDSALIDVAANGDKTLADTSDGSGVDAASLLPNPFSVSTNGTSTASRTVKDNATNESDAGTLEVNVDAANPTLGNCPTAGPFILKSGGGTQSVGPISASDNESGVDNAASTLTGSVNTGTVGEKAVTFRAVDHVGHEVTKECKYNVNYAFSGFLQPINNTAHQTGTDVSTFKAGSTVPVKFVLKDANGNVVQSASALQWLTPQKGSATSQAVDESVYSDTPTTGDSYRWDTTGQQYIYNWGTAKNQAGFYWRIGVKLDDGQTYYQNISLR
jgi:CSLREA domain-containing protein